MTKRSSGACRVDAVGDALQVVVEPPELQRAVIESRLRPEVAVHVVDSFVRTRIHHHVMQRRLRQPAHHRVVPDRSPRIVVPARDAEHRHLDPIEPPFDAQPAPVSIVFLVIEPVVPELRTRTARLFRRLDDGQVIERLHLVHVADVRHRVLHRRQAEPRDDGGGEDHVDVGHDAQRVGGGDGRGDRREVRGLRDRGVPGVESGVGAADHPDLAVAARQRRRPFDGVVPVLLLHRVHVEHAAGAAAAAHVLLHVDVAARRPELAVGFVDAQIRRALEDDAEGAVADRPAT